MLRSAILRPGTTRTNLFFTKFLPRRFSASADGDRENIGMKGSLIAAQGDNAPKPRSVLVVPLTRRPLLPGYLSTVFIQNGKVADAVMHAIGNDLSSNYIGLFLRSDVGRLQDSSMVKDEQISSIDQLHKVGTFAQVQSATKTDNGLQLLCLAHRRITLVEMSSLGPPCTALVSHWAQAEEPVEETPKIKAYVNEVMQSVRELVAANPLVHEHVQQWVSRIQLSNPFKLADFAAAMTTGDAIEIQKVLESKDAEERLALAVQLLGKEKELIRLQMEIQKSVEDKMTKQQREYFLREQLKSIKQELGMEKDDKDVMLVKYNEKLATLKERNVSSKILQVIEDEINKIASLERNSPEFNVTRSYVDTLLSVPWGLSTADRLDLASAQQILDEDHFGMEEIKRRILEFIAVGKLKKSVVGKIICFIGPPGVGKTSIAKSIARALDRKFYRFSVGGLTDIAEIKGHRRTYIGAMPGKPILALKSAGCANPLILIDEVDKLGRGYNGDPASALLELLDPNQNESFVDHYIDVPVDFSNVLFVCTANDESAIPGPLRDRMEVIRLSGYDIPEKVAIASRYLVPKALKESGLTRSGPVGPGEEAASVTVTITNEVLEQLARNYCRESGVRSLEKHVEKVARKIAFKVVEIKEAAAAKAAADGNANTLEEGISITVTGADLESYLGKPRFSQDTIYECGDEPLPVGIVMGLAWNPLGGSPIFIETAALSTGDGDSGSDSSSKPTGPWPGGVQIVTGQLGSVMRESVNIAFTFARKFVSSQSPAKLSFFRSHQLHLHVPEGAVEKDGPSAGVAMTCSFVSIALGIPLKPRLAMTGELSLTGKVLPVGGIKEKVLAAKRSGADTVILPRANKRDYDELPAHVKESVTVHFVGEFKEVFSVAFPASVAPPAEP